MDNWL